MKSRIYLPNSLEEQAFGWTALPSRGVGGCALNGVVRSIPGVSGEAPDAGCEHRRDVAWLEVGIVSMIE